MGLAISKKRSISMRGGAAGPNERLGVHGMARYCCGAPIDELGRGSERGSEDESKSQTSQGRKKASKKPSKARARTHARKGLLCVLSAARVVTAVVGDVSEPGQLSPGPHHFFVLRRTLSFNALVSIKGGGLD